MKYLDNPGLGKECLNRIQKSLTRKEKKKNDFNDSLGYSRIKFCLFKDTTSIVKKKSQHGKKVFKYIYSTENEVCVYIYNLYRGPINKLKRYTMQQEHRQKTFNKRDLQAIHMKRSSFPLVIKRKINNYNEMSLHIHYSGYNQKDNNTTF